MPDVTARPVGSKRHQRTVMTLANTANGILAAYMGRQGDDGECPCDCGRRHPLAKQVCADFQDGPDDASPATREDDTAPEAQDAAQDDPGGLDAAVVQPVPVCPACRTAASRWRIRRAVEVTTAVVTALAIGATGALYALSAVGMLAAAGTWAVAADGAPDPALALAHAQAYALVGIGNLGVVGLLVLLGWLVLPRLYRWLVSPSGGG